MQFTYALTSSSRCSHLLENKASPCIPVADTNVAGKYSVYLTVRGIVCKDLSCLCRVPGQHTSYQGK